MVDPDQLAVALAVAVAWIFQVRRRCSTTRLLCPDRAGIELDHHVAAHHRLQVGVQRLQDHWPLRRMIDVDAGAG